MIPELMMTNGITFYESLIKKSRIVILKCLNLFKKIVAVQSPVVDFKTGHNSFFFSVFMPLGDMTLLLLS